VRVEECGANAARPRPHLSSDCSAPAPPRAYTRARANLAHRHSATADFLLWNQAVQRAFRAGPPM